MAYTVQKAKLVDRTLKKEVRRRKRNGSLNFTGKVDRPPYKDLLRLMGSIRRREQDAVHTPGPGLPPEKLDSYADYFTQELNSQISNYHNLGSKVRYSKIVDWGKTSSGLL